MSDDDDDDFNFKHVDDDANGAEDVEADRAHVLPKEIRHQDQFPNQEQLKRSIQQIEYLKV